MKFILFFVGFSLSLISRGQPNITMYNVANDPSKLSEVEVVRNHIFFFGLNTDGWGFGYDYVFGPNKRLKNFIGIEFKERKHPKEYSIDIGSYFKASLIYGKQNIAYPISMYYGKIYRLGDPNQVKGVEVDFGIRGGLSLALMRPYYITIDRKNDFASNIENIKYSIEDSLYFFDQAYFYDVPYLKGLGEMKPIIGFNFGTLLNVDFSGRNSGVGFLAGFKVAANVEWYTQKLDILVNKPNIVSDNFFISGTISVSIGSKKLKLKNKKTKL